ncbi:type I restriction-modification system methyltransferase subunit [Beggiatoa alba B18LD]|uniref:site-specific DNA-methyltransferase (adenine-specific) n=1 Tax=Beggiatoa alba B18LD TaxID=395493 RepID=I3CEY2_9GAMM|nr:DNA methyltransferase [Beggiatoa alba]EIJ42175.1 type I restriction-modification system methyltransferase subunit [Beggiatoa alba B18LD]
MSLFRKKVIDKNLTIQTIPAEHYEKLNNWQTLIETKALEKETEISLQGIFMQNIMVDVLGYVPFGQAKTFNIMREYPIARGKVDLALGTFSPDKKNDQLQAVFELKGAKTKNLDAIMSGRHISPVQQAWNYARNARGCQWVLVSNYLEIRLYAVGETSLVYEHFDLAKLTEPAEYSRFILCLHASNLLTGKTYALLEQSRQADKDITAQLYNDYRGLRENLLAQLIEDNPNYSPLELIAPAQKLLDRILFIAFAEDNALLPANSLEQAYKYKDIYNKRPIFDNFKGLFNAINKGNDELKIFAYNGGLFANDKLIDKLQVSDNLCQQFCELAKYDFNFEIPVTILGHIFEQSITDLEEIHQQIVSGEAFNIAKKAHAVSGKRKQHGIVYTPDHITAFIVEQTLGDYLQSCFLSCLAEFGTLQADGVIEWRKGKQIELKFWYAWQTVLKNIKIVDPACGSGAFLIAAFDFLHAEYTRINQKVSELTNSPISDLFDLDKEILQNNLNGVDLNPESIEISKLSLWLKTAKKDKKLALINQQLQVGNSLGFHEPAPNSSFYWQQHFAKIIENGGFDVVLGNPPYVRQEFLSDLKPYFQEKYQVYHGVVDLYAYFFELGFKLLKPQGMLGFICSSTFFKTSSGKPLREFLQKTATLTKVVDFGDLQIFEGVTTYPAILIFKNQPATAESQIKTLILKDKLPENLSDVFTEQHGVMAHAQLNAESWQIEDARLNQLRAKLTQGYPTLKTVYGSPLYGIKTGLNEAFIVDRMTRDELMQQSLKKPVHSSLYRGVLTGLNEAFILDRTTRDSLIQQDAKSAELLKPFLEGKDLKKWHIQPRDLWLILIPKGWTREKMGGQFDEVTAWAWLQKNYISIAQWLEPFAESAQKRTDKGEFWWELRACAYYEEFEKPKIIWADIACENKFFLTQENYYLANTAYMLPCKDYFLLAWLNSKACTLIFTGMSTMIRGGFFRYIRQYIDEIIIPPATDEQKAQIGQLAEQCQQLAEQRYQLEIKLQRRFADLGVQKVNQRLEQWWLLDFQAFQAELKKSYKTEISLKQRDDWESYLEESREKHTILNQQLQALENQINQAVYALFNLTTEEISLIEK